MQKGGTTDAPVTKTASAVLTDRIPIVRPHTTIAEIETLLLERATSFESINYIYVTDAVNKLVGVLSLKELFRTPKSKAVKDIMRSENLVSVKPHTNEERIAYLAIERNLKEIPVTDQDGRLAGVVPPNAIFRILHQEHINSMLKSVGVHRFRNPAESILNATATTLVAKRLPWLLVGLFGSALAAVVVNSFRAVLEKQFLLAAFMPAIAYIADAVGTQSETIFIRTLAIDRNFHFKRYILREAKVGLTLGIILGLTIATLSFLFWRTPVISAILGLSFFIGILAAITTALLFPWVFSKFKIDPAFTSGPFDTVLSDIVSLMVYFGIASFIFNLLNAH